jgi:hypothetical protein
VALGGWLGTLDFMLEGRGAVAAVWVAADLCCRPSAGSCTACRTGCGVVLAQVVTMSPKPMSCPPMLMATRAVASWAGTAKPSVPARVDEAWMAALPRLPRANVDVPDRGGGQAEAAAV